MEHNLVCKKRLGVLGVTGIKNKDLHYLIFESSVRPVYELKIVIWTNIRDVIALELREKDEQ